MKKEVLEELKTKYSDEGIERGGYIKSNGEVVEVENVHPNKIEGFAFSCDDLDMLENEDVIATFHTHPNGVSNLTKEDSVAFRNWSDFLHFIIGKDGIMCYRVTDRDTIVVEEVNESED